MYQNYSPNRRNVLYVLIQTLNFYIQYDNIGIKRNTFCEITVVIKVGIWSVTFDWTLIDCVILDVFSNNRV